MNFNADGNILVLSWPDTYVSAIGSLYDPILKFIGLNKGGMYKAGHAALVLICNKTGRCEFFDFGRYITPNGKGRVRGSMTDPEVTIPIKALFDGNQTLQNLEEILRWLDDNPKATHGEGRIVASVCTKVNYKKTREFILDFQSKGSMTYSPFYRKASNCSRFVAQAVKVGTSDRWTRIKNTIRITGTPSPLGNVANCATDNQIWEINSKHVHSYPAQKRTVLKDIVRGFIEKTPENLKGIPALPIGTVLEPQRPDFLESNAVWLGGKGAGAWFQLLPDRTLGDNQFLIQRIDRNQEISFSNVFKDPTTNFKQEESFEFVYDCNAAYCTIFQHGEKIRLEAISVSQGEKSDRPAFIGEVVM